MTTQTAPPAQLQQQPQPGQAPATFKQTTIYKHLDLLEHLIDDAVGIYKFKAINADEFLDVLDKARARLPEELREASDILQQRDEIIAESQRRAEQVISTARRQAESMLHESELLKAVQAEVERIRKQVVGEVEAMRREAITEADRIRIDAEEEATRVREGADHYAESVLTRIDADLNNLGTRLQESQSIVRNGQRLLGSVKRHSGGVTAGGSLPLSSPLLSPRVE